MRQVWQRTWSLLLERGSMPCNSHHLSVSSAYSSELKVYRGELKAYRRKLKAYRGELKAYCQNWVKVAKTLSANTFV